jgi:hypothetical protein
MTSENLKELRSKRHQALNQLIEETKQQLNVNEESLAGDNKVAQAIGGSAEVQEIRQLLEELKSEINELDEEYLAERFESIRPINLPAASKNLDLDKVNARLAQIRQELEQSERNEQSSPNP